MLSHLVALSQETPPQDDLAVCRLSILDWMVCGLRGASEPVSQAARHLIESEAAAPQATLFGGGHSSARSAALHNGAASHALDYDDTHFAHIGHPSVAILPAAFAVAEHLDASGVAFQRAALLGMEASISMGIWLGRTHYQAGFHQTATAGAFGATFAVASLLGLSEQQLRHALCLTATRAAGLKAQFGTDGKPYNAGLAAQAGVEMALLAAHGMTSTDAAFQAFCDTHHGEGRSVPNLWHFGQVQHKFHACCHGLHAMLEALATCLPAPDLNGIEIIVHPRWEKVCHQVAPETGLGAKFSYTTTAAMAVLGHDTARPESFTDEVTRNADVVALRRKVQVRFDPSVAETTAHVRVTTSEGVRNASHDLTDPLPYTARETRMLTKAGRLLGRDRGKALWQAIISGEDARTLARALSSLPSHDMA